MPVLSTVRSNQFGKMRIRNSALFRWSNDGKHFVSGSADGSIKIWDAVSNRCISTFLQVFRMGWAVSLLIYRRYVVIGFCAFASAPLIAPVIDPILLSQVYYQVGSHPTSVFLHKKIIFFCYLGVFYLILFHCLSVFFYKNEFISYCLNIFGIVSVTAVQFSCTLE